MKSVTCSRSNEHHLFQRPIEVQAPTVQILDENLQQIEVLTPINLTTIRRYSEVNCYVCGAKAHISLK